MQVPFVDLKAQYTQIKKDIDNAIRSVVEDAAFVGGKYVESFEKDFAAYCGCKYGVGVSSGTSALQLALQAMGVGEGDEVIAPANTFIATCEAITHAGATPRLVDVDERTYTIDVNQLEDVINKKTKVIIPVHLYGQPANMEEVTRIAERHGLMILEDAAQAQGAEFKGRKAGSIGHVGAFSFYPAKNLGAYGDAGMVVTDNEEIAAKVRLLSNHGRRSSYDHAIVGYNERLDGLQAAILSVKLGYLDKWNEMRRQAAQRYNRLLKGVDVMTPEEIDGVKHIYHLYVIRVRNRDTVRQKLAEKGVATGIHYPIPIHLLDAYKHLGYPRGSCPVTEKVADEILSLPMFPEITEDQQQYVVDCLKEVMS